MKTFAIAVIIFNLNILCAQSKFPEMETVNVEGEKIVIPEDLDKKQSLIVLAFSKKAEKDLKSWFKPVYNKFLAETDGLFASFTYDINVFFVPMFTGIKTVAADRARAKAAEDLDPALRDNLLFYKGQLQDYKNELELEERKTCYLFVLNKDGKIIKALEGSFSEEKMKIITSSLD